MGELGFEMMPTGQKDGAYPSRKVLVFERKDDGWFKDETERYEILPDGSVNAIYHETGPMKYFLGADDTYINGEKLGDGDGIFRGGNKKLQVVHQDDQDAENGLGIKSFLEKQNLGKKDRMIFTQNGVNNTGLEALELNNSISHVMEGESDYLGDNYKGTMQIYNRSRGTIGGWVPIGDIFNLFGSYVSQWTGLKMFDGFEGNSMEAWDQVIDSGALNHGGLVVPHSQGSQIVTHAFKRNSDKKTNATLVTLGGAHSYKPTNLNMMYDMRNYPDKITTPSYIELGTNWEIIRIRKSMRFTTKKIHVWKRKLIREGVGKGKKRFRYVLKPEYEKNPYMGPTRRWDVPDGGIRHSTHSYADALTYLLADREANLLK